MTATAKISKVQAQEVIDNLRTNKGIYAMDVPKTNGCITLENGVKLRKLPVKFRNNDPRSKAFRLKGSVEAMRNTLRYVTGKSVSMTIKQDG
jgi:hypothetical protein